jgi:hypothetical protein
MYKTKYCYWHKFIRVENRRYFKRTVQSLVNFYQPTWRHIPQDNKLQLPVILIIY